MAQHRYFDRRAPQRCSPLGDHSRVPLRLRLRAEDPHQQHPHRPREHPCDNDTGRLRAPRDIRGVSPTRARRRTRELSPGDVRRSCQHLPRESHALPRGGEYVLLRVGELCQRRRRHDGGGRTPGRYAAVLQPYGQEGLLVADLDLSTATGLLASRCRVSPM